MAMNIFQIPASLLENIVRRTIGADPGVQSPITEVPNNTRDYDSRSTLAGGSNALGCTLCDVASFADVAEQRAHYRSDWHRYNVKAKLTNKKLLNEKEFAGAVAELSDSISGSESSDSDEDSDSNDAVQTALSRARKHTSRPDSPSNDSTRQNIPKSPIQWFHSAPSTQIGVYGAVFPLGMDPKHYAAELKAMQLPISTDSPIGAGDGNGARIWTMFMTAGGHFAGMVVRVSNSPEQLNANAKTKGKHKPAEYEVLMHKTFHRYTTRRKQGGSQSINDNAKGPAKSAGAQLRRYGEQALRDDIRALLAEWKDDITASERIWIRANVSNKRIFYDYDDAPFAKDDERLRSFPFQTRRPTHTELIRCLNELVHAKVSHFTEAELKEQDDIYLASLPKPKPVPVKPTSQPLKEKAGPPKKVLTKEQEEHRNLWQRLVEMAQKGRTDALSSLWERVGESLGGVNTLIPAYEGLEDETGWTLLHVAAAAGQESTVTWLLQEQNANPTTKIGQTENGNASTFEDGVRPSHEARVPYEVALNKATRDVFRRLAGVSPNKWDWLVEGKVPSVLSREMEEEQDEKKKTRRKGLKDKMKEREEKRPAEEVSEVVTETPSSVSTKPSSGPQKLGGVSDAGGTMGLTADMRARIERERRARAIEARMQRTNQ